MVPGTDLRPILLVDDNEDDVFLLQRRLRKAGVHNPVRVFHNGETLIEFLRTTSQEPGDCPFLLLLDLKMPCVDGFEILESIRTQQPFKDFPVVVVIPKTSTLSLHTPSGIVRTVRIL